MQIAVVLGGPRLGDLEAGGVAEAFGTSFSVVSGGLACVAGAYAADPASFSNQTGSQSPAEDSSSSTHRKSGANSGHHTKVAEEVGPPPELTKAEELIQKKDYLGAEPLLRKQ